MVWPGGAGSRLAIVGKGRRLVFEEPALGGPLRTVWRLHRAYGLRALGALRGRGAEFIRNFSRLYDEAAATGMTPKTKTKSLTACLLPLQKKRSRNKGPLADQAAYAPAYSVK